MISQINQYLQASRLQLQHNQRNKGERKALQLERGERKGGDSQADAAAEGLGEVVEIVAEFGGGDLRRGAVGGHGGGKGREGREGWGKMGREVVFF